MNESRSIDDASLDRLVDGELTADQRRDLLAVLERSSDGWRRCALAFVESQTLGEALDGLLSEGDEPAPRPLVERVSQPPAPSATTSSSIPWATAAAVLVAFGLGLAIRGGAESRPAEQVATVEPAPVVEQTIAAPEADPPPDESLLVWVADDRGDRHSIRAPLMDADAIQQRFGVRFDPAPPSDVVQQAAQRFEEQGYRLSTKRRFAPLFIGGNANGGGQPIVVPVDDVQVAPIRYVSL